MLPRRLVDAVSLPDGRQLELFRRGEEFLIQIDRDDLMGSRSHGSEEAMARLVQQFGARAGARQRWLVGGLGMGFTLRACLDALDADAEVIVAEVFEAVVRWNRDHLGDLASRPLDDPRVRVAVGDVFDRLAPGGEPFDAILLDVDNGPEAMTLMSNERLYRGPGLRRLRAALGPGGVLAVWSAFRAPDFESRLTQAGFRVEARRVRARQGKGERHTIVLATPTSADARAGRRRARKGGQRRGP